MVMILWMISSNIVFCQIIGMKYIGLMVHHLNPGTDIQLLYVEVISIFLEELIQINRDLMIFISLISIKENGLRLILLEMHLSQEHFIDQLFLAILCI